jgi:hypothetical protein
LKHLHYTCFQHLEEKGEIHVCVTYRLHARSSSGRHGRFKER